MEPNPLHLRGAELVVIDDLSSTLDVETERALWERVFEREDASCNVPITSSFSRMAGSMRKGRWTSCSRPMLRWGGCGGVIMEMGMNNI